MFGYLLFFRMSDKFGFTIPPGHTNMVQMIITLKVPFLKNKKFNEINVEFSVGWTSI